VIPDLRDEVRTTLEPHLANSEFRIVAHHTDDSFDNAFVVLATTDLRLRIIRERGKILVDFGPPTEPDTWFDSAIVMEYLDVSSAGGLLGTRTQDVLPAAAAFVNTFHQELAQMFAPQRLPETRQRLDVLKERRAERLFGWRRPGSESNGPRMS